MLTSHRTLTNVTVTVVVFRINVLSLFAGRKLVSACGFVPVVFSVKRPLCLVLVSTELLETNLTVAVAVSIDMSSLILTFYVMFTARRIPVIILIVGVFSFVGMLVIVVPLTTVAYTVVVFILVLSLVSNGNVVSTSYVVPVIIIIVVPFGSIFVGVIVVPLASVAYTVVVFVLVLSLVSNGNIVSTSYVVPVIILIVIPFGSICVGMIVVPRANVTKTVVIFVLVVAKLILHRGVLTYCCVPVSFGIVRPIFREFVRAVLIQTYFAESVIVFIGMRRYVLTGNVVSTRRSIEVILKVVCPFGFVIRMLVTVVPITAVTETVIVLVLMNALVDYGNGMSTSYVVPVIILIVIPLGSILMLVIIVPITAVAYTVVICVYVSCLINAGGINVTAICCVPVIFVIVRPIGRVGVVAELILANLTNTVKISVGMSDRFSLYKGVAGCLLPVIYTVEFIFVGELMYVTGFISASSTLSSVFVKGMTRSFHSSSVVSALRRMPVSCSIILPCGKILLVIIANYFITYVAVTVIAGFTVFVGEVYVSAEILTGNIVTTSRCVPVVIFIGLPYVFVEGVLVLIIPATAVANTVVVGVSVSSLALYFYIVITGNCVPVIIIVVAPSRVVSVLMVVVPETYVTDSVVIVVLVGSKCFACNVVIASGLVPVLGCIVRPFNSIGVSVVVIPFANVANTVVVLIFVSFLILRLGIASAGGLEVMIALVIGILVAVFVLTENVIANVNVAFSVVVIIYVSARNVSLTFVTFEVFVGISVYSTGN